MDQLKPVRAPTPVSLKQRPHLEIPERELDALLKDLSPRVNLVHSGVRVNDSMNVVAGSVESGSLGLSEHGLVALGGGLLADLLGGLDVVHLLLGGDWGNALALTV